MDRRWQLVLDCLDTETPPFSKGTLVTFRHRLLAHQMDRRLLERTVELAATSGAFGARQLRAALDSSPLWGAGRVEDTYNLLGHALRKALGVIARQQGRELPAVADEAGALLVSGSSLKAALDLDWDEPTARQHALTMVLDALNAVDHWLATQPAPAAVAPQVAASLAVAQQVRAQDVTLHPRWHAHAAARGGRRSAHQRRRRRDAPWAQEPEPARRWLQTPCAARSGLAA